MWSGAFTVSHLQAFLGWSSRYNFFCQKKVGEFERHTARFVRIYAMQQQRGKSAGRKVPLPPLLGGVVESSPKPARDFHIE